MTAEVAAQLRKPFEANEIGKLPKVTCRACRDSPSKNCSQHSKERCRTCGNWMTSAHMHVDYVGHAELTDRLLQVDREWSWKPMATNHDGVPFLDTFGGLWIELTIAGVMRLGYGHADGKKGGDAIKEAIGDALRNAGMRFGIALDLWGAKFEAEAAAEFAAAAEFEEPQPEQQAPPPSPVEQPALEHAAMVNQYQHRKMHALWRELGYDGEQNRLVRLDVTAKILRLPDLDTSAALTEAQANSVIAALEQRLAKVKQQAAQPEPEAAHEQSS